MSLKLAAERFGVTSRHAGLVGERAVILHSRPAGVHGWFSAPHPGRIPLYSEFQITWAGCAKFTAKVSRERFAILYVANYECGTRAMGCFNHLIWRVSRRSARWTAAQPCQAIASNLQRRPHRAVVERLVNGFAQRLLQCDAKVFHRPKDARTEIDKRAIQI